MFDRTTIVEGGPSDITIHKHEHRAPTDESIRLAKEYEEKAWARVIDALRVDRGNTFTGTVIRLAAVMTPDIRFVIVFELNGEKYQTDPVTLTHADVLAHDKMHWAKKLRDEIALAIADKLIVQALGTFENPSRH